MNENDKERPNNSIEVLARVPRLLRLAKFAMIC